MKYLVAIILAYLSFSTVSSAQDQTSDPAKETLDKAKAEYDAAIVKLQQSVLDSLQKKEDAARKDGDKKLVDQLKAERQAFEDKGELPKTVNALAYQKGLKQTRMAMEAAYRQAVKDYLQAKMDAKADFVSEQLKEFQKETTTVVPPPPVLTNGSWEGKKVNLPKGDDLSFVLKVAEVNGRNFTGNISVDKGKYTFAVTGQVIGERIVLTTEKKGLAQQTFDGKVSKDRMELLFLAITETGASKKGTVSLTLKKK